MEAVFPHSVGGVVGDSTSTAQRGVEAALDGTKGDAGASLSGVSPASQDVSNTELSRTDSSLLFSQAGQSPTANRVGESPQVWEDSRESSCVDRSASLRQSMTLASGPIDGRSSDLSPRSGSETENAELCQSSSPSQVNDHGISDTSVGSVGWSGRRDLCSGNRTGDAASPRDLSAATTNSQSDLRSTGQTGDAVSPRTLSSDRHQSERKQKRKWRPRCKSKGGGRGRTPPCWRVSRAFYQWFSVHRNAGTIQTGGRTSCVEGRTNSQRPGSGHGRRSAGDCVGRPAVAGPVSQPQSQNRSDSRDQRALERSGTQQSGPQAVGAHGQKGGPSSRGGKAAGDSKARKPGPWAQGRPNFPTQTTSSVDDAPWPRPGQGGPESPVGPERPSENSGHRRGNNGARARRRQVATRRFDGPEAQRLQRLFRRNRKSCVREILNGSEDRRCNILLNTLESYFSIPHLDNPPAWLSDCLNESDPLPEWDSDPISADEVKAQLCRMSAASAPGPDHLPYKVWKALDQNGSVLAHMFEVCRKRWKILFYSIRKGTKGFQANGALYPCRMQFTSCTQLSG